MHGLSLEQLAVIEEHIALAMTTEFDLDTSALALDMTNFATYIDSANAKAPIPSVVKPNRSGLTCAWSVWDG